MSNNDEQSMLLIAIEHLKYQYSFLQNPCVALLISTHYRLLSNASITRDQRENYANNAKSWLTCYVSNQRHSQKMQHHLQDFIQLCEFSALIP